MQSAPINYNVEVTQTIRQGLTSWVDSDWFDQRVPKDKVDFVVRLTDLWMETGSMAWAIDAFKLLVDEAYSSGKTTSWIVDELRFEEQVLKSSSRQSAALESIKNYAQISDQLLDNYNARAIRPIPDGKDKAKLSCAFPSKKNG